MGGTGSGRWGDRSKQTLEAVGSIRITASEVLGRGKSRYNRKRSKDDAPIMEHSGSLDCRRPQERDWLTISFVAVTHAIERVGFVDFSYVVDGKVSEHRIHLQGQQQPFGGLRWYFECPVTRDRVHTLCLPRGGRYLASREGYKLAYQCQHENGVDRAWRRAWKARRRLAGVGTTFAMDETLHTPLRKPRYRHWEKFDRGVAELEAKTDACDLDLYRGAARFGIGVPSAAILKAMVKRAQPVRVPKAYKRRNAEKQIERELVARAVAAERWARDYYGPAWTSGAFGTDHAMVARARRQT